MLCIYIYICYIYIYIYVDIYIYIFLPNSFLVFPSSERYLFINFMLILAPFLCYFYNIIFLLFTIRYIMTQFRASSFVHNKFFYDPFL